VEESLVNRFDGKVAFVTGAAAGIGRATSIRLASEGASVFLVDLASEGLEETAKLCEKEGADVAFAMCDISDEAQVQANIQACVDRFGRLDTLCNIAGILLLDHFAKITVDQFRRVLEVNLVGTFMLCQAALPHLLESKGSIVNTSSTSALAGMPYGSAYGTSKGGVSALTRTLAVEFGKQGVRCNAVNPGSIKTAMMGGDSLPTDADPQLLMRAMSIGPPRGPEVVAATIAMLASEDGIHINGEEIRVDGGTLA
jgi:meso-butanediol dehydrogenase/(S,S)-butanediol dehydrogenase/diacetyl reductase